MFSGATKRSSRFGLVGLLVVVALVIAIATTTAQGEANPKLTLGLIFAVLAIHMAILFTLQRAVAVAANEYAANSKRVEVRGDPEGIVVRRKGGEQADWLCDLWLAERLASP